MNTYDAIVIGTGGIGGAALACLARQGLRVAGLDRFAPGHDRGSSHGQTRIIRQAYFEHPDYVPLVRRCYPLWRELEAQTGRRLYRETGLLQIGPAGGPVIQGVFESAALHGLAIEQISPGEIEARWPLKAAPVEDCAGLFEAEAGYLLVEACVLAQLEVAQRAGAELRTGVSVLGWKSDSQTIRVETDQGTLAAERIVVTAGAWAGELLTELGLRLQVLRKGLYWFRCDESRYQADAGMPAYLYELPEGIFYGFPKIDTAGVKLAEHSGGRPVGDPLAVPREIDTEDRGRVERFARAYLPDVSPDLTQHATCLYTMTPDEHFLVDHHPADPRIVLAAGLSGHGFKFAPVLGEALADLALHGKTDLPIGFLSLDRPGVRRGGL